VSERESARTQHGFELGAAQPGLERRGARRLVDADDGVEAP
jgi:hypothetical protein